MKLKNIRIPADWKNINSKNHNIDVFVDTDDGYTYTVSVATPKTIEFLMDKEKKNYYGPGCAVIFVRELTTPMIDEAIKAFAEDYEGYWLKVHDFAGSHASIEETVFHHLKANHLELLKEFEEPDNLD